MIRLRSLGESVIEIEETRIGPQQEVSFALLLRLLLAPDNRCLRVELMELLWPDNRERQARHCLRQVLYNVRKRGARVLSDGEDVVLDDDIFVDFRSLDLPLCSSRPDHIVGVALGIRGAFLRGFNPDFSASFSAWLEHKREQVHATAIDVLVPAIRILRRSGDWEQATLLAQRCLDLDPLNEDATVVIAEAAALSGHSARALAVLETFSQELADTQAPPSRATRALHQRLRAAVSRFVDSAGPLPIPLFGREAEVHKIHLHLQEAREGRGRIVLLTGPEGIGKSRLGHEAIWSAQLLGLWQVALTTTVVDNARPFALLTDLASPLLNAPGALGASPTALTLLRGLQSTSSLPDSRHPEVVHSELIAAFMELLGAVCDEQPVLVVIDDAHWLDRQSWLLLQHLEVRAVTLSLVVLLLCRNANAATGHISSANIDTHHHSLAPLSASSCRDIVEHVSKASGTVLTDHRVMRLVGLSGGNPLFASELARCSGIDSDDCIPQSLRALVARRLSHLSSTATRTFQLVALLDGHCTIPRLAALLGCAPNDLISALSELEGEGLLKWEEGVVREQHGLIGTIALSGLSPLLLAAHHISVAALLESTATEDASPRLLWAASEHWRKAGESDRAVGLLGRCARESLRLGSPEQASEQLNLALRLTSRASERSWIIPLLVQSLVSAGRWAEAAELAVDMEVGDHSPLELLRCEIEWRNGSQLRDVMARVRSCALDSHAPSSHRIRAASLGLIVADNMLAPDAGHELFNAVSGLFSASGVEELETAYCTMIYATSFGNMDLVVGAARVVKRSALSLEDPYRAALLLRHAAVAIRAAGGVDESLMLLHQAYGIALSNGLSTAATAVACALEGAYLSSGDFSSADQWADLAAGSVPNDEDRVSSCQHWSFQARLALLRRRFSDAQNLLERAKAVLGDNGSARARMFSFALEVRIKQECERSPTDASVIEELIDWHLWGRGLGKHDLVMEALYFALHHNRPTEAKSLYETYVSIYRRERDPVAKSLSILVGENFQAVAESHSQAQA